MYISVVHVCINSNKSLFEFDARLYKKLLLNTTNTIPDDRTRKHCRQSPYKGE